jgi:hypothetical protein
LRKGSAALGLLAGRTGWGEAPLVTDRPLVEAPLLVSEKGAALTLLNWPGEPLGKMNVTAHVPFVVGSVRSVKQGRWRLKRPRAA